jgi:transposase-like protein
MAFMPWQTTNQQEQRHHLIIQMRAGHVPVAELCRTWGISRKTAYKWRRRFRAGRLKALRDKPRRPVKVPGRTSPLWLERIRRLRRKRPTWGARKLHWRLRRDFGGRGLPAAATISRWLRRWGLVVRRRSRRLGPVVLRRRVHPARFCHEVWTVDFKGWYRIGDGMRVYPLTVRDLYSRHGLCVHLQHDQSVARTRRKFVRIFREHGLPQRIRCDNGTPFGAGGPTGLTRLSAWWVKLGIEVAFMTPASPYENGSHEHFHKVYKAEVAESPARRLAGQQRRSQRWLRDYNEERPNDGLGLEVPAKFFRKNPRLFVERTKPWSYPLSWERRWVRGNGEINWRGKRRYVGEAFVRDYVGLKAVGQKTWRVYFGPVVIGDLRENERGNIRTARYRSKP